WCWLNWSFGQQQLNRNAPPSLSYFTLTREEPFFVPVETQAESWRCTDLVSKNMVHDNGAKMNLDLCLITVLSP
ncbi:MAG: hypothetical protein OQK12_15455, partial [Motiliproteus sp.]|nr:hypothetical protein [Motiliproteus sp.]MCW9053594.1 hypothetical protein [Motiliproteus sp.]